MEGFTLVFDLIKVSSLFVLLLVFDLHPLFQIWIDKVLVEWVKAGAVPKTNHSKTDLQGQVRALGSIEVVEIMV